MASSIEWFVRKGAKEHGPFQSKQLKQLAADGKLTPDTEVRRGADSEWVRAAKVKGLFPDAPAKRPASPVQAPSPAKPDNSFWSPSHEQDGDGEAEDDSSPFDSRHESQEMSPHLPERRRTARGELVGHEPAGLHTFDVGRQSAPAVQVNVQQPTQVSNSLGIASMVLGILAFFMICIPPVGFFFSGLGFLLGAAGLFMALKRGGSGIGFPIAGTAISSVGVVALLLVAFVFTGVAAGLQGVAEEIERTDAARQQRQAAEEAARDAAIARATDQAPQETGDTAILETDPPDTNVVSFGEKFTAGPLTLSVLEAVVRRPELRTIVGDTSRAADDALIIALLIQNRNERKIVRFRDSSFSPNFVLHDDVENHIRGISYGFSDKMLGQLQVGDEIQPESSVTHREPFSVPPPKTEFLILKVSLEAFGEEGEAEFVIPAAKIDGFNPAP